MEFDRKHQNMLSREGLYLVFRHKWLLLSIIGFGLVSAIIMNFLIEKKYEASAKILVKLGRERSVNNLIVRKDTYFSVQLRSEDINSEIEIIKSPDLVLELVKQTGVKNFFLKLKLQNKDKQVQKAVKIIQKNLSVDQIINTNVIAIRYRAPDPQIAANIVNQLIELYMAKHIKVHSAGGISNLLLRRKENSRLELEQIERELEDFYAGVKAGSLGYTSPLSPRTSRSQASESIGYMEKEILELEFEKKRLLSKYKPDSQPIQLIEKQITEISRMLKKERQKYAAMEKKYNELERKKKLAEERNILYARKLNEALIQEEMDQNKIVSVHVISRALPPLKSQGPGFIWRLGLALGISLMLSAVLIVFFYYIDDTFYDEAQLEMVFNLPVAASVPWLDHQGVMDCESISQKRIVSTAV